MRLLAGVGLALGIALTPGLAQAQAAWPERPITFVVPYAPGGYTDLTARLTARYVEKALGKPVVIDSRPGAGGIVGTQAVASAAPDGYTFLRLQCRRHLGRAVCPEGRLRSDQGPRPGQHHQHDRAGGRRQEGAAGEVDGRARGLRQGQPRQAQLWLQRRRRSDALLGRMFRPAPEHTWCTSRSRAARRPWPPCCPATSICRSPT
jgi:hypothetical protein